MVNCQLPAGIVSKLSVRLEDSPQSDLNSTSGANWRGVGSGSEPSEAISGACSVRDCPGLIDPWVIDDGVPQVRLPIGVFRLTAHEVWFRKLDPLHSKLRTPDGNLLIADYSRRQEKTSKCHQMWTGGWILLRCADSPFIAHSGQIERQRMACRALRPNRP